MEKYKTLLVWIKNFVLINAFIIELNNSYLQEKLFNMPKICYVKNGKNKTHYWFTSCRIFFCFIINYEKFQYLAYFRNHTFMILHWATPVTVNGTPCAVSTPSHIGFSVITSSDSRCTSVTSHHAHAQPPTIVRFFVEPQHPPGMKKKLIKV